MNWVGGSRNRYMKHKEETIKQRAFFQKQRMKTKCNNNLDPQTSPNGRNTGNVDLLTLFIVNQIASKKENTDKPKINRLINAKKTSKTLKEPLELPMSPCSPSNLNLATSQPLYSVDTPGFKVRKHGIAEEFKFRLLSPVLESNLSDASGSDNQPHILNTITPFSPASTGIPDPFSIQLRPVSHVSSSLPCQENPNPDSTKPMKPANPCTDESKEAHVLQNSPVAKIQFGIALPNSGTERSAQSVVYPPSPLKSSEQQEEPLFIDFSNRDCEEHPHTEKTTKIFLEKSLSSFTRVRNSDRSQNMDCDGHFLTQAPACNDCNTSVSDDNGFVSVFSGGCYLSSIDKKVDQCLQCACSNKPISNPEDSLITKHCCLSVSNSTATPSQAPSCKQKAKSNRDCQNETEAQRHNGNTEKPPPIMQDAGTQTTVAPALSCCDVSVQCLLIHTDRTSKSITFSTDDYKTSVLTTRRHSVHFNESLTSTTISSRKVGHTRAENVHSEASATEQEHTHPKLQEGFSFRKPQRQTNMKKTLTPILKRPLRRLRTENRAAIVKQSENREV